MICLVVHMRVKPGTEEECKRLMRIMQDHTRKEPGCIQYDGFQSVDDSTRFTFFETYKDREALAVHSSSEYFKQYVKGGLDTIVVERTRELSEPIG